MKKVIFINLLLLLILFFFIDFIFYTKQRNFYNTSISYFGNLTKKIAISDDYDKKFLVENIKFRPSLNDKTKEKGSIIFTGCSFIYGTGLKDEQIISYKVSELVKNPIYNLSVESKAINTTIALLKYGIFDNEVKVNPNVVIYNYADFHLLRLIMANMPFETNEFMYFIRNGKLERKRPPFIVQRFVSLYLLRVRLFEFSKEKFSFYREYLKKLLKLHFIEMKKILNDKYPSVKFVITVYYPSPIFEEISEELEREGIIILRITENDFCIDTLDPQYQLSDGHPNNEVWEIVAPKLVEKLKPYL